VNIYTVSFFGHRKIENFFALEARMEHLIRELLRTREYVEFLVGRNGEFDQLAASTVLRLKRLVGSKNSSLILVLPYMTAEFENNQKSFASYYDEIEISEAAAGKHFKAAIQTQNCEMVDRSDMVICYVTRKNGGAYSTVQYAQKQGKRIFNVAENIAP